MRRRQFQSNIGQVILALVVASLLGVMTGYLDPHSILTLAPLRAPSQAPVPQTVKNLEVATPTVALYPLPPAPTSSAQSAVVATATLAPYPGPSTNTPSGQPIATATMAK